MKAKGVGGIKKRVEDDEQSYQRLFPPIKWKSNFHGVEREQ